MRVAFEVLLRGIASLWISQGAPTNSTSEPVLLLGFIHCWVVAAERSSELRIERPRVRRSAPLAKMLPDLWGWFAGQLMLLLEGMKVGHIVLGTITHPTATGMLSPKDDSFDTTVRLIALTPSPSGVVTEMCSIPKGLQRISWIASP